MTEDQEYQLLTEPERWQMFPLMPLIKRDAGDDPVPMSACGFLHAEHGATVYIGNVFDIKLKDGFSWDDLLGTYPCNRYPTLREVVKDYRAD